MRKYFIVAGAIAALAVPSAAMAVAPSGDALATKDNAKVHMNAVANGSSGIIQNGQWVGGSRLVGWQCRPAQRAGLLLDRPDGRSRLAG